jgi:myxalamid-type polyketide synthase MxaC
VPIADALYEDFVSHFRAKVDGAWNLHSALVKEPLDFFILFSSASAVLNSPRIGPYAAANAFLDALAHYRRGLGLAATSINWGAWTETGMLTHAAAADRDLSGVEGMTTEEGLFCLDRLLGSELANVSVLPLDWQRWRQLYPAYMAHTFFSEVGGEGSHLPASLPNRYGLLAKLVGAPEVRRAEIIRECVHEMSARVLGFPPGSSIDSQQPLSEYGLDSLMALELRNLLAAEMERSIPATLLFNHPTVEEITAYLLSLLYGRGEHPSPPQSALEEDSDVLSSIEELSDEQVEALLQGKFGAAQ